MEETEHFIYTPPVAQFLSAGEPEIADEEEWPNYLEQGLNAEHIPELIHMATREPLITIHPESPRSWAPIYAWRALGQLRATAASEPLLALFEVEEGDNGWVTEELPDVYGMLGESALPALVAFIADRSHGEKPRLSAVDAVVMIGQSSPDARSASVAILSTQLAAFQQEEHLLNENLIHALITLDAKEAAPLMKQVLDADATEILFIGEWDDIQERLGLLSPEQIEEFHQRREAELLRQRGSRLQGAWPVQLSATPSETYWRQTPNVSPAKKATHKDKLSKQARKKNRKR